MRSSAPGWVGSAGVPTAPLAWKVMHCAPGQRIHASYPFGHHIGVFNRDGMLVGMTMARPGSQLQLGDGAGVD